MQESKQARLEAKGWRVGSAEEFLGLSNEESAYLELRLRLAESLRARRRKRRREVALPAALAEQLGPSPRASGRMVERLMILIDANLLIYANDSDAFSDVSRRAGCTVYSGAEGSPQS
jgi:hypothetical protein